MWQSIFDGPWVSHQCVNICECSLINFFFFLLRPRSTRPSHSNGLLGRCLLWVSDRVHVFISSSFNFLLCLFHVEFYNQRKWRGRTVVWIRTLSAPTVAERSSLSLGFGSLPLSQCGLQRTFALVVWNEIMATRWTDSPQDDEENKHGDVSRSCEVRLFPHFRCGKAENVTVPVSLRCNLTSDKCLFLIVTVACLAHR